MSKRTSRSASTFNKVTSPQSHQHSSVTNPSYSPESTNQMEPSSKRINMATIGSFEAKTHLASLLDRVQKGEHITITKRGVPVAMLVPAQLDAGKERSLVIAEIKEFGRGRALPPGCTVRDLIEEGRRF